MIILDYRDTRPLYEQIVDKFQTLILKGVLEPNSRMPSVRSLAVELYQPQYDSAGLQRTGANRFYLHGEMEMKFRVIR